MLHSLTQGRKTKRVAAATAALALAIAAPAAIAGSSSASPGTVHAYVDRSGTTIVSGYDGGAPLAPKP